MGAVGKLDRAILIPLRCLGKGVDASPPNLHPDTARQLGCLGGLGEVSKVWV